MNIFTRYTEAFSRCYPGKTVSFATISERISGGYWVVINGEKGARPLQHHELESAIQDFNRGRFPAQEAPEEKK